jgi:hypothetical protein
MTPAVSTVMIPLVVVLILVKSNDGVSSIDDGPVGAALQAPSMTVSATVAAIRADVFIGRILGSEEYQAGPRTALALLFDVLRGQIVGRTEPGAAASCALSRRDSQRPMTVERLAECAVFG